MTMLSPFFNASFAVQLHVGAALLAVLLLPLTLWRRRRDRVHRVAGYVWTITMGTVAVSSFFINGLAILGPFGLIHLISVYVLWGLFLGVRAAIRGEYEAHRGHMAGLAFGGLGVAGLVSFMPGRMMNRLIFDEHGTIGFAALSLVALFALALMIRGSGSTNQGLG